MKLKRFRNVFTPKEATSIKGDETTSETSSVGERGQWGNQAEFILSCLGYAMGLGNVWKFPYTCFSNGGGAYLIPYIVVLAFVGIPTFFLELIMGQYSGKGPVEIWCLAPVFQGVGLGMLLISAMVNVFYTMLLTYCLYYLAMCFQYQLPWDTCQHSYNTPLCFNPREAKPCTDTGGTWYNNTCYNSNSSDFYGYDTIRVVCYDNKTMASSMTTTESSMIGCYNQTYNEKWEEFIAELASQKLVASSQEYFLNGVLEQTSSIDVSGGLKWDLVLCLFAMWVACFLCLVRGIESSGKVVYFTTTFPYVVLTILLIRGVLLEGSIVGIRYLLTPDWNRLADAKVWGDAAGQIFFALSVGCGGLLTYSSYNKFHGNVYRDMLIVAVANSCTDWYAGFVVFSALGYMATAQHTEVKDVATDGSGLAFVVYPQVLATLPVPQLWSAMFFFMLILLGLDSLNAGQEAIITATVDQWPWLRKWKVFVTAGWCFFFFLIGLTMCMRSGYYWLDLVSYYSSGWTLIFMGIIESVIFSWIYGAKKVMAHLKEMAGFKLHFHWWIIWTIISPVLLIAVLIFNFVLFKPLTWNGIQPPAWALSLGWLMAVAPLGLIVIFAVVQIVFMFKKPNVAELHWGKRILLLFKPNEDWMSAPEAEEIQKEAKRGRAVDRSDRRRAAADRKATTAGIESDFSSGGAGSPGYVNGNPDDIVEDGITSRKRGVRVDSDIDFQRSRC